MGKWKQFLQDAKSGIGENLRASLRSAQDLLVKKINEQKQSQGDYFIAKSFSPDVELFSEQKFDRQDPIERMRGQEILRSLEERPSSFVMNLPETVRIHLEASDQYVREVESFCRLDPSIEKAVKNGEWNLLFNEQSFAINKRIKESLNHLIAAQTMLFPNPDMDKEVAARMERIQPLCKFMGSYVNDELTQVQKLMVSTPEQKADTETEKKPGWKGFIRGLGKELMDNLEEDWNVNIRIPFARKMEAAGQKLEIIGGQLEAYTNQVSDSISKLSASAKESLYGATQMAGVGLVAGTGAGLLAAAAAASVISEKYAEAKEKFAKIGENFGEKMESMDESFDQAAGKVISDFVNWAGNSWSDSLSWVKEGLHKLQTEHLATAGKKLGDATIYYGTKGIGNPLYCTALRPLTQAILSDRAGLPASGYSFYTNFGDGKENPLWGGASIGLQKADLDFVQTVAHIESLRCKPDVERLMRIVQRNDLPSQVIADQVSNVLAHGDQKAKGIIHGKAIQSLVDNATNLLERQAKIIGPLLQDPKLGDRREEVLMHFLDNLHSFEKQFGGFPTNTGVSVSKKIEDIASSIDTPEISVRNLLDLTRFARRVENTAQSSIESSIVLPDSDMENVQKNAPEQTTEMGL